MEAGKGDSTETWKLVQPELAKFAKVCSYDRAGLGRSSASVLPQTVDQIAEDLRWLLSKAKVGRPYILVAHSLGGIYIRDFDRHYPEGVFGMVLVDSSHEEQLWRFAKFNPALRNGEWPGWSDYSAMAKMGYLPPGQHLIWRFDKLLIVIEHTPGMWPKEYGPLQPIWHELQKDLASGSPRGKLITAAHSAHYV